ncbi:MAG: PilT/PilU family type 4a pilus ATPase [Lachnospiraceae bacterium]|nr:PilT/PilU family type 4a pilus ATPase [Lachnospiraceae bacterium]
MISVRDLLGYAVSKEASDIHVSAGAVPKLRIHGELIDTYFPRLSPSDTLGLLLGLISQEQRERFEREGEIDMSVSVEDVGRFRINAYKQRGAITLAFRVVSPTLPDPMELGLPPQVLSLTERRRGLVFVTGPSGSGRSTVIAALIDRINAARACNIITLEDPIEYLHESRLSVINQREIGLDVSSYEAGLSSCLKEDPDVIYVSDLSRAEDVMAVLRTVETGRLVFSSMYTSSAEDTIRRILELFEGNARQSVQMRLSRALLAVVSRKLLNGTDGGRIPAHEILLMNKEVRDAISCGEPERLPSIIKDSAEEGMCLMEDSLLRLVQEGRTEAEEALLSANDPEALEKEFMP